MLFEANFAEKLQKLMDCKTISNYSVVVKSALCLVPPTELWAPIQKIREKHDKQFVCWMPHINLIYPFHEDSGDCFSLCESKLRELYNSAGQRPFDVKFDYTSFDHFEHNKSCTLILRPNTDTLQYFKQLHSKLKKAFPETLDSRFPEYQPHLSLGQFRKHEIGQFKDQFSQQWKQENINLKWTIKSSELISRKDFSDPFSVKRRVYFEQ